MASPWLTIIAGLERLVVLLLRLLPHAF